MGLGVIFLPLGRGMAEDAFSCAFLSAQSGWQKERANCGMRSALCKRGTKLGSDWNLGIFEWEMDSGRAGPLTAQLAASGTVCSQRLNLELSCGAALPLRS
jgi:hypothetical protein